MRPATLFQKIRPTVAKLPEQLRPKRMREAAALWEQITAERGVEGRDGAWSHPDLLPALPDEAKTVDSGAAGDTASGVTRAGTDDGASVAGDAKDGTKDDANGAEAQNDGGAIDWDAELSKLLGEDGGENDENDSAK